jgi:hypothetical protein
MSGANVSRSTINGSASFIFLQALFLIQSLSASASPAVDYSPAVVEVIPQTVFRSGPAAISVARTRRRSEIMANLERCSLSTGASIKMTFQADRSYPRFFLTQEILDKKDSFYFQQAVWDACPLDRAGEEPDSVILNSSIFSNKAYCCSELIMSKIDRSSKQSETLVAIHIIPPGFSKMYPSLITEREIHSEANLRIVDLNGLSQGQLKDFEERRVDYFSNDFTSRERIEQAKEKLLKQFSSMFWLLPDSSKAEAICLPERTN